MYLPSSVIQVFCKAPIVGQVKTRLMPQLTAKEAAEAHRQLATQTFKLVQDARLCPIQLWCSPSSQDAFFLNAAKAFDFSLHTQVTGDIGVRMDFALTAGLKEYSSVILLGCDCPSLTVEDLSAAITALQQGNEVVLAPTEDGGYSLIGLNAPQPALFKEIAWSTAAVMAQTRQKTANLKLRSFELKTQWDVDTYADYERYKDHFS